MMTTCQRCGADRVIHLVGKTSDMCSWNYKGVDYADYPPDAALSYPERDGWGMDYVDLEYCLNCGQIQGEWPRPDRVAKTTAYGKARIVD